MKNIWRNLFGTAALAFVLCLTGLVMSGEAQAQRFVDNGNGTVTDTATNLMWTKNADPFGKLNWDDAMSRCGSFSISGIGGWRLPSAEELLALNKAIRSGIFTEIQSSFYWSSSTTADQPDVAWWVYMNRGQAAYDYKTTQYNVWPVRAGQ